MKKHSWIATAKVPREIMYVTKVSYHPFSLNSEGNVCVDRIILFAVDVPSDRRMVRRVQIEVKNASGNDGGYKDGSLSKSHDCLQKCC